MTSDPGPTSENRAPEPRPGRPLLHLPRFAGEVAAKPVGGGWRSPTREASTPTLTLPRKAGGGDQSAAHDNLGRYPGGFPSAAFFLAGSPEPIGTSFFCGVPGVLRPS